MLEYTDQRKHRSEPYANGAAVRSTATSDSLNVVSGWSECDKVSDITCG